MKRKAAGRYLRFRTNRHWWNAARGEELETQLRAALKDEQLPIRHRFFLDDVLNYIAYLKDPAGKRVVSAVQVAAWVNALMREYPERSMQDVITHFAADKLGLSRQYVYRCLKEVDATLVDGDPFDNEDVLGTNK